MRSAIAAACMARAVLISNSGRIVAPAEDSALLIGSTSPVIEGAIPRGVA
jgi:hypothetical protein